MEITVKLLTIYKNHRQLFAKSKTEMEDKIR